MAIYAGSRDDADFRLRVGLSKAGARLSVAVGDGFLDRNARSRFREIALGWASHLGKRGCHLQVAHVAPVGDSYPRSYPPREAAPWPLGALDYHLGRKWHGFDEDTRAAFDGMARARLPTGAERKVVGEVLSISFAADPTDPAGVAAARATSHEWIARQVPTQLADGWNELGDRQVIPIKRSKLAPFTFFDPEENVGYKALAINSGKVDEDTWDELAAIARAGKHRGREVDGVRLVVPVRAEALKVHARAIRAGFEMVMYPEDSSFWQVKPPAEEDE